jgi:adenosylcobinamide-phosphate synthase
MDGPGPLAIAAIALLANALLAGLPGIRGVLRAPEAALDGAVRWLDAKLNRPNRGSADLGVRGALVVACLAGLAAVAGLYLSDLALSVPRGWIIDAVVVTAMLSERRAFDLVRAVRRALSRHGAVAGRVALAREARYDTGQLDEHAVARGAIEHCAARFCDGVVAPLFWYLILGMAGLLAHRAINVAANRIGVPTQRHAAFGFVAARLDQVLNALPAPLCGVTLAIAAAFVPGASPARALRIMVGAGTGRISWVTGWMQAAFAGALDLSLAGPRRFADRVVSGPWIGDGRARATSADIARAGFLFAVACTLITVSLAALALALTPV